MSKQKSVTVIDVSKLVQRILGFIIGFFLQGLFMQKMISWIQSSGATLPSQIPMVTQLLGGGIVATILILILIVAGLKLVTKVITFVIWLIIGVIAAFLLVIFTQMMGLPNLFDVFSGFILKNFKIG